MKLSSILAFLPLCAALPTAGNSVQAGNSVEAVSSPLAPRQLGAAFEVIAGWFEAGSTTSLEAEFEVTAEGELGAQRAGTTVTEFIPTTNHLGQPSIYVGVRKVDAELGLEGHGEFLINKITKAIERAKGLSLSRRVGNGKPKGIRNFGFGASLRAVS